MSGGERFGQFPARLVLSGELAASEADRTELLALMAIASHAGQDFTAYPSMETIARYAGVKVRAARSAVRRLEERGVISVDVGGGRGRSSRYTIHSCLYGQDKPSSTVQPGIQDQTRLSKRTEFDDKKPGRIGGNTRQSVKPNPVAQDNRGTNEQKNKQQQEAAAVIDNDLIQALTKAGIRDPKRSDLARLPGLTTDLIRAKHAWCKERNKGAGVLIQELEIAAEPALLRQQKSAHAVATIRKRFEELPEPALSELNRAKDWLSKVGRRRVYSIAGQMGGLRHEGAWILDPVMNDKVLVECCRWAVENSMLDANVIESLAI